MGKRRIIRRDWKKQKLREGMYEDFRKICMGNIMCRWNVGRNCFQYCHITVPPICHTIKAILRLLNITIFITYVCL